MDAMGFPKVQTLLHHGYWLGRGSVHYHSIGHLSRRIGRTPPYNSDPYHGWHMPPLPGMPTTESSLSPLYLVTLPCQWDQQMSSARIRPITFHCPLPPSTQVNDLARVPLIWTQGPRPGYSFKIFQCSRMRRSATLGKNLSR